MRQPFDWQASLAFLRAFPAMQGEQTLAGDRVVKAWRIGDQTVLARVSWDDTGTGALRCELGSVEALPDQVVAAALDRIGFFLSVDDDLAPFYTAATSDPAFAPLVARLRGYHQVKLPSVLENICWAVLAQRAPMAAARAMKARLVGYFDNDVAGWGGTHRPFPSLEQLAGLPAETLSELVRHARKSSYLHGCVAALTTVDENFLRHGDYEQVRAWLLGLPGIGPWSASFVLIRGLGRMERAPQDPEGLKAASAVYGRPIDEREFHELAAHYGDHQGYWAHYLRVGG
ncbi:hypothetical protein MXD59_02320 [Frankia sp. Ag45/Mut15]|uniref:DNA-3-methyladenine glycosylase II n=1 Tax=Frankia umida TaxID=573489 RepID=A0ABT0JSV0_9ACTN|nr:hypothetical protein [Frankia umida]MCK9874628.1 hypothetical protein [Frankia umida]